MAKIAKFKQTRKLVSISSSGRIVAWLFLLPALIVFLVFKWLPIVWALILSFLDWDILTPAKFIGGENYFKLFGFHAEGGNLVSNDPLFWKYFGNTLYFTLGHLLIGLPVALLIANLLSRIDKGRCIFKFFYLLPLVATGVGASMTWRWLLNPDFGLINCYLAKLGVSGPAWLSSIAWAKSGIIITDLWAGTGIGIIVYLATLRGTVRLKTITLLMSIFIIVWSFYKFTEVYMMTGGGPAGATTTLLYYLYNNAFQWFKLGYASTISFLMLLILFALGLIMWKVMRRTGVRLTFSPNPVRERATRLRPMSLIIYAVLSLGILLEIMPFLWAFSTSLKKSGDTFTYFPQWVPSEQNLYMEEVSGKVAISVSEREGSKFKVRITEGERKGEELVLPSRKIVVEKGKSYLNWKNYQSALRSLPFGKSFLNSVSHCIGVCLLQVIICFMAAYSLSILKPPGRNFFWFAFISTMFIPCQVLIVPIFILMHKIGWLPITNIGRWPDFTTYKATLFPYAAWGMGIFLFKIFLDGLPKSLVEKARVRGDSEWKMLWRKVLPEAKPMLLLVSAISFILSWHHFFIPLIMGGSRQNKILTMVLASFQGLYTTDWTLLMAGVCLVTLPMTIALVLIFKPFNNHILSRLTITTKT